MPDTLKNNCPFTNERAFCKEDLFHGGDDVEVTGGPCGTFLLTKNAWIYLSRLREKTPHTQGLVNCAYRTLEVSRSNPLVTPVWALRHEADGQRARLKVHQSSFEREPVLCVLEDSLEEQVDHSKKQLDLLDTVGARLGATSAFELFKFTPKDRLSSRILHLQELGVIVEYLRQLQYVEMVSGADSSVSVARDFNRLISIEFRITPKGWEAIRARNSFPRTNKVFIATQFKWKDQDQDHREMIDAIISACNEIGYEARLVTQDHTENITDRIIAEIRASRFVVAEFTYNNRGVYFESGFARGLGRPVFHLVRDGFTDGEDSAGKKVHFDISQIMYRIWKTPADLKVMLKNWILATIGPYSA